MGEKSRSTFMLKQRAFLKIYLIYMAEQKSLYGLQFLVEIKEEFKQYGYSPTHSEIYKSLHELIDSGILKRRKVTKEGMKFQEVVYYTLEDKREASLYKKQLKVELDRCHGLLGKAIKDIYQWNVVNLPPLSTFSGRLKWELLGWSPPLRSDELIPCNKKKAKYIAFLFFKLKWNRSLVWKECGCIPPKVRESYFV